MEICNESDFIEIKDDERVDDFETMWEKLN
jgi:hypothetical protein